MDPSPVPEAAPAQGGDLTPARKRARFRLILIGILGVLLVGGGVAAAGGYLGWYGSGGTHPYDVMPASTIGYVQLDLNPSLEQKTQAWSFLHDLPEVQGATPGQPDPKRFLWSFKDRLWVGSTWTDYARDVAPWLGDRIGVGVLYNAANHDAPQVWVTAIQVTDAVKAVTKIQEWLDATQPDYEVTTRDGYAIITPQQSASFFHAEQAKGMLGSNSRFTSDLRAMGDAGWMAGWVDFGAVEGSTDTSASAKGRAAFAMRLSAGTMEFNGRVTGWNHVLANGAGQLGALPASTGSAVCISGGGPGAPPPPPPVPLPLRLPTAPEWWTSKDGLTDADVSALLGQDVCVSAPATDVGDRFNDVQVLGLRVVTNDPGRAQNALHKVSSEIFDHQTLVADRVEGNVLTAATTKGYLAELAGSPNRLSSLPAFITAVPEHTRAALGFYVNLETIAPRFVDPGSPYLPFLTALKAIGGQYFDEGSGNGSWSVRVVRA